MTLVEGFGDEVLCMFALIFIFLIAVVVWASTSVSDRPRSAIVIPGRVVGDPGTFLLEESLLDEAVGFVSPPGNFTSAPGSASNGEPPDGEPTEGHRIDGGNDAVPPDGGTGSPVDTVETEEEILSRPDAIKIKLKYVNDSDKSVNGRLGEKLVDFKRRNFRPDLAAGKFVRLIFQGRLLSNEEDTLEQHGLFDNCVVHCHVSNHHPRPGPAQDQAHMARSGFEMGNHPAAAFHHFNDAAILAQGEFEIELGNWMMPVAGFLLSILWSYWYQFGHFFSFLATVCLTVLTGLFFTVLLGIYSNVWSAPVAADGAQQAQQQQPGEERTNNPTLVGLWNLNVPLPNFLRYVGISEAPPTVSPAAAAQ